MINLLQLWNKLFENTRQKFSYRYYPFIKKFDERNSKVKVNLDEWLDKNKLK